VEEEKMSKKSKTTKQDFTDEKPNEPPLTLAERMFFEQFNQHLEGKETNEYPKMLEDI